jgi:hypothetical protein
VDLELGDRPIVFQRSDDEEEERRGEEVENVREVPNEEEDENEEDDDNEEHADLECVMWQTRRSHVVAPPIAPAWKEDRVLIKPLGDK